jgi:hypothetical protein
MSLFNIIDFSRLNNNAYNKQEPINKIDPINKSEPINKMGLVYKKENTDKLELDNKQEDTNKRINNWFCNCNKNSIFYKNISIYVCKK